MSAQQPANRTLALLIGAIFVVSIDSRVITPILPAIADDLGVSIGQAGLIVTAYLLPYGLFQLLYGPVADRVGHVRVVSIALGGFAVGEVLCALAPDLGTLVAFRFITGIVAAATFPLTLAYIGETVDYTRRQTVIGYTVMAASVGQVLSAAAGGFLASILSWRAIFALDGLIALAITVLMLRTPASKAVQRTVRRPAFAPYRDVLADRRHVLFYLLIFVEGGCTLGAFSYFGVLLRERDGFSYAAIGAIIALFGTTSVLAGRFIGRISRSLGERRMIAFGGAGVAVCYASTIVQPVIVVFPLAMALLGISFIVMHSTFQTRATEISPSSRATGISLFAFSLFLGSSLGALLTAQWLESIGYNETMLILASVCAAFTVVAAYGIIPWSRPSGESL